MIHDMSHSANKSQEVVTAVHGLDEVEPRCRDEHIPFSDAIYSLPGLGPVLRSTRRVCDELVPQEADSRGVRAVKQTARWGVVAVGAGVGAGVGMKIAL